GLLDEGGVHPVRPLRSVAEEVARRRDRELPHEEPEAPHEVLDSVGLEDPRPRRRLAEVSLGDAEVRLQLPDLVLQRGHLPLVLHVEPLELALVLHREADGVVLRLALAPGEGVELVPEPLDSSLVGVAGVLEPALVLLEVPLEPGVVVAERVPRYRARTRIRGGSPGSNSTRRAGE